jgi:epoxide hydrolase 4
MLRAEYHLAHGHVQLDEVALHYVEAGDGPSIVLLHGFPEFWYSWRHQLPFLAEQGFRAIAPDLRGYNLSSHPAHVAAYRMQALVSDAVGLINSLCTPPVVVVGHDWGGIIAWRLAAIHPELVRALVILNAPHPSKFRRELRRNPVQWLRSAYAGFFQLPRLPEYILRARNFAAIRHGLRRTAARPAAFSDYDLHRYADAFLRGGTTGPLNYYRAALKFPSDLYDVPQMVAATTLCLWGDRDPALSSRLTDELHEWVPNLEVVHLPSASHWVQHDEPQRVNHLLAGFFAEVSHRNPAP